MRSRSPNSRLNQTLYRTQDTNTHRKQVTAANNIWGGFFFLQCSCRSSNDYCNIDHYYEHEASRQLLVKCKGRNEAYTCSMKGSAVKRKIKFGFLVCIDIIFRVWYTLIYTFGGKVDANKQTSTLRHSQWKETELWCDKGYWHRKWIRAIGATAYIILYYSGLYALNINIYTHVYNCTCTVHALFKILLYVQICRKNSIKSMYNIEYM